MPTPNDPPGPPGAPEPSPEKANKPTAGKGRGRTTFQLPSAAELRRHYLKQRGELDSQRMRLEFGWIARIIGAKNNAPRNIAFLTIIMAFFISTLVTLTIADQRLEIWKFTAPIITLAMGYVFGKNSKD